MIIVLTVLRFRVGQYHHTVGAALAAMIAPESTPT
jgi:hypothetical protein